jgi:uncharacterized membrane protein YbaN (DUF454 family)
MITKPGSWLLLGTGWLSLALGVIGIFLPLLPTVPFLLLASACFARSSPRFHSWLLNHPTLGPPIVDWQQHRRIRPRAKIMALSMMALSFSYLLFFTTMPLPGKIILALIGLAVATRILSAPSY